MTGFLAITVVVALAVPGITGGSYTALLFDTRWEWPLLFAGGVGLSVAADHLHPLGGFDIAFGVLVASYALLLVFCGRNVIRTGMTVVLIGLACNALAITVNHGMPVRVPQKWVADGGVRTTVRHHATDSSTRLYWMGDVIYFPPTDEVISFGDLILAVGLADLVFHASRRRRRSTASTLRSSDDDLTRVDGPAAPLDEMVRRLPRDAPEREVALADDDSFERVDRGARTSVGIRGS